MQIFCSSHLIAFFSVNTNNEFGGYQFKFLKYDIGISWKYITTIILIMQDRTAAFGTSDGMSSGVDKCVSNSSSLIG